MHTHTHRSRSSYLPRPDQVPDDHRTPLPAVQNVKRTPGDSGCDSGEKCTLRQSDTNTQTIAIALGVIIPLTAAIILFFFLHRRHLRRLRQEDANDKHKSLDFGMDVVPTAGKKKNKRGNQGPSMAETQKELNHGRHGISMDMNMSNPYLLPPGLHGSRESLHSLSRTLTGEDDKYRPAVHLHPGEKGSMRSNHGRGMDDSSSYTAASAKNMHGDEMRHNLLGNAQRMSRSPPILPEQSYPSSPLDFEAKGNGPIDFPLPPTPRNDNHAGHDGNNPEHGNFAKEINLEPPSMHTEPPKTTNSPGGGFPLPPAAPHVTPPMDDDKSDYGDESQKRRTIPPPINVHLSEPEEDKKHPSPTQDLYDDYLDPGYPVDPRRLTMGMRPLPPEDPSDNPEQRANRIRSFYKEYFDESKPAQDDYYEDYGPESYDLYDQYGEAGYYGSEPRPFAEPVGRRAMTPPPRMPGQSLARPRFGAPSAFGHRPGMSMASGPGPRAFSSASGHMPGRKPRKPIPPPAPLHVLPTPHKLKDDSFLPMDFAPANSAQDRRAGRPETPLGGLRPYMPTLPAHSPLASSYDDLALLPSPHMLRKSGAFTGLDFVPPPRFRNADGGGSDAGSIRSNKTGLSAAQSFAIRSGAHRISRLPAETVGTREDIVSNLHPKWDIGR